MSRPFFFPSLSLSLPGNNEDAAASGNPTAALGTSALGKLPLKQPNDGTFINCLIADKVLFLAEDLHWSFQLYLQIAFAQFFCFIF